MNTSALVACGSPARPEHSLHEVVPMKLGARVPRHAACMVPGSAAGLRDETTTDAQSHAREEPSIVAALCTCVLGEREGRESAAWPPRSVAELSGRSGGPASGRTQDPGVLERGLDALDELALRETGRRFARLGRRAQMRALFQLEEGGADCRGGMRASSWMPSWPWRRRLTCGMRCSWLRLRPDCRAQRPGHRHAPLSVIPWR